MRGAVWAVPTVTVSSVTPAFASSRCARFSPTLSTSSYTFTDRNHGAGTATSTTTPTTTLDYSVLATSLGGKILQANNLTVAGNVNAGYNGQGELTSDGLQFQQNGGASGYASRQDITITFEEPVTNLKFTIFDIDRTSTYVDAIATSIAPTSIVRGTNILGSATVADPLRASSVGDVSSGTLSATSTLTYAGPLTTLKISFWSTNGTGYQQTFLSNLEFQTGTC